AGNWGWGSAGGAPSQNLQIDAMQASGRFAQRSGWEQASVTQPSSLIDHGKFEVARQAIVLQAVVANDDLGAPFNGTLGCGNPVRTADYRCSRALRHHYHVVPCVFGGSFAGHIARPPSGPAAVTTEHDTDPRAAGMKLLGQPDRHGGLARAADCDVADDQ